MTAVAEIISTTGKQRQGREGIDMSSEPLVVEPVTIDVDRHTLILLMMLKDALEDEPPDVVNVDEYYGAEQVGLACYKRLRWEQLRDGLTLGIGHALVRQVLEASSDAA